MAQTQKVQAQVLLDLKRTTPFPVEGSQAFPDKLVTASSKPVTDINLLI